MGWKLRKDKLRADAADDTMPVQKDAADAALSGAKDEADAETAAPIPIALGTGGANGTGSAEAEEEDGPTFAAPFDLSASAFAPYSPPDAPTADTEQEPLLFDKPDTPASSFAGNADTHDAPAFGAPVFDPETPGNDAPTFGEPSFAANLNTQGSDADDAPTFGLDSAPFFETEEEAPSFAAETRGEFSDFVPLSATQNYVPDTEAGAFVMPAAAVDLAAPGSSDDKAPIALGVAEEEMPVAPGSVENQAPIAPGSGDSEAPIALGSAEEEAPVAPGDGAGEASSAFVPYQPRQANFGSEEIGVNTEGDDFAADGEMEVGAMPFDPQAASIEAFAPDTPTAGEELGSAPAIALPADTAGDAPMAFEPAFDAPVSDIDALFMDREALAAGLVSTSADTGLPRVAPFVLDTQDDLGDFDPESGPHSLVLRMGNLSATYPLLKPVLTIGRPDAETASYPDVEVELDDGVSRRHAEVRQDGSGFFVVDLGSTNGTILNGTMLQPDAPARLMRGDHIRIGERTELVFE